MPGWSGRSRWRRESGGTTAGLRRSTMEDVETTRLAFRPGRITTLFVGESAPFNGDFFYRGDPLMTRHMRTAIENSLGATDDFLATFKGYGWYLYHLVLTPVDHLRGRLDESRASPHEPASLRGSPNTSRSRSCRCCAQSVRTSRSQPRWLAAASRRSTRRFPAWGARRSSKTKCGRSGRRCPDSERKGNH